jgi:hypothetical protein
VVNVRQPQRAVDGATFQEKVQDVNRFINGRVHPVQRIGVLLREGFAALLAAESLKAVAVFSESVTFALAIVAGHFGLRFLRSKPIMKIDGSALRLTPRVGLAPVGSY